jgi:hypothetical protein
MKRKIILISVLLFAVILIIAAFTKPSDKKIMIETINAVWGKRVPDKKLSPRFYNQFMDETTQAINIDDWLFIKRIKYTVRDTTTTIGFGVFGKVFINK